MRNIWFPLTALSYFVFYTRDIMHLGYKFSDLWRVYALNLMMIPINVGGVMNSLSQMILNKKIPFKRTPKVVGRTASPALYVGMEYFFFFYCAVGAFFSFSQGYVVHALFSVVNGGFFLYAIVKFIGVRASIEDLFGIEIKVKSLPTMKPIEMQVCHICAELLETERTHDCEHCVTLNEKQS